jgi:hypothetical protein
MIHGYFVEIFNFIRKRAKTTGISYQYKVSKKFNTFINTAQLLELPLSDRKFTWAKSNTSTVMALLDRFFCSLSWHTHFLHTIVISLPRFLSDHTPLILCINKQQSPTIHILRFEKKFG